MRFITFYSKDIDVKKANKTRMVIYLAIGEKANKQ